MFSNFGVKGNVLIEFMLRMCGPQSVEEQVQGSYIDAYMQIRKIFICIETKPDLSRFIQIYPD